MNVLGIKDLTKIFEMMKLDDFSFSLAEGKDLFFPGMSNAEKIKILNSVLQFVYLEIETLQIKDLERFFGFYDYALKGRIIESSDNFDYKNEYGQLIGRESADFVCINSSVADFYFAIITLMVFHYVLLKCFFEKAEEPELPFLVCCTGFWVVFGMLEFSICVKDIFWLKIFLLLDLMDLCFRTKHLPVIVVSLINYVSIGLLQKRDQQKKIKGVDL